MNSDVTDYLAKAKPWQQEVCTPCARPSTAPCRRRGGPAVRQAALQLDGRHAAVLHVAAAKVSFMVFDAGKSSRCRACSARWAPATARSSTSARATPSTPPSSPTCCAVRPARAERTACA